MTTFSDCIDGCRRWAVAAIVIAFSSCVAGEPWISNSPVAGGFPLVESEDAATIVYSEKDAAVVGIAVEDLADDVQRVTGHRPTIAKDVAGAKVAVIVGTIGQSPLIDQLARDAAIDVSELEGAWESFLIATSGGDGGEGPRRLFVLGSDRRGTAYGVYELAEAIGVSPWHWWADVPAKKSDRLWVQAGMRRFGPPSVKYRGIFINDEDWGLHPWASHTFDPELGDIGPKTYEKVFELMLRLKANTLWPAMHEVTKAFNLYPENKELADRYGIVMASSHAEPMLRNNVTEWTAPKSEYNYATNRERVLEYWEQRLEENARFENVYSLGMRGIHDSGITAGETVEDKVALLQRILKDQRALLREHVSDDLNSVPQAFTPYKEVLDLYEAGLEVPEDVTLVWPDDNHGFIRRLPVREERDRSGGSGVYYHISYLGSPMAYLWLNTTPPALIWEEMTKAYALGARDYWILNVGDIKPGELGMEFFLQLAWNIDRWSLDTLPQFLPSWSSEAFGSQRGEAIGRILETYFELNYQRRPEHLQWWLPHGRAASSPLTEAEIRERLAAFDALVDACNSVKGRLEERQRDAYFELVEYPVKASAFANRRYFHAEQYGRLFNADPGAARIHGALARRADAALEALTCAYNEDIAQGKWNRFMAEEPADNMWRSYRLTPPILPAENMVAELGEDQVDLSKLSFAGAREHAAAVADVEREAESFDRSIASAGASWKVIPGLGRTGDSIAGFPVTWEGIGEGGDTGTAGRVEYEITLPSSGEYTFYANLIPTYPIDGHDELRVGVRLDNGPVRMASVARATGSPQWKQAVLSGSITAKTTIAVESAGAHTLQLFLLDPGVVVDKWFLHQGELEPRFLGPEL